MDFIAKHTLKFPKKPLCQSTRFLNVILEHNIMDSLRSSVAPFQEYLLQGSILDSHCDLLLHRLNGLCDNIDTGPEKFHDQDLVYTLRKYGRGGFFLLQLAVSKTKLEMGDIIQLHIFHSDMLLVNITLL